MKILFIGDIVGKPGRQATKHFIIKELPKLKVDFVIANGENAAGGKGLTPKIADELFSAGIDVITGGNHIWSKKDILSYIDNTDRLIRPANYPDGVPGKGSGVFQIKNSNLSIGVTLACGRVFMANLDCPFKAIEKELSKMKNQADIVFVDFHAEATSEKIAMGWFLDGKVTACLGTHTHIPTADECILPGGTAYITDVGMTGPYDSVIGVKKEEIIESFQNQMMVRHEVATGDVRLCGVIVNVDEKTCKATGIKRILYKH